LNLARLRRDKEKTSFLDEWRIMETFALVAGRSPMPSVFREMFRRTYETRDEPLPPRLEELLQRLSEAERAADTTQRR
jgi:hypothetical protein